MPNDSTTLAPDIRAFVTYMTVTRNKAERTATEYARDIARFAAFISERYEAPLNEATTEQIEAFIDHLQLDGRNLPQSVRRKTAALGAYFRFLMKKRLRTDNPADHELLTLPDVKKRLPKVMDESEIAKILRVEIKRKRKPEFQRLRDKAILEVFYGSGLRRFEVSGLDVGDVDLENRSVHVRHGKGDKERWVPCSQPAADAIRAYLEQRPAGGEALFVGLGGARLTPRSVWKLFRDIADAAELKQHVVPHTMRHSFATHLHDHGAPLLHIQKLLGHSNINTTTIYTHVSQAQTRENYDKYHPRALSS